MDPGSGPCPWDGLEPANLRFCEEPLCGWVTEPANTWTNAGFVVVGVLLVALARRERGGAAGLLGPIAIATGLASTALHATSTLAGQLADQSAMFLESALFVTLDVRRSVGWRPPALVALYALLCLGSAAVLLAAPTLGIALFVAHVALFLALELRLFLRPRAATRYGPFVSAGGVFAASYLLWWLDRLGILCDPENHVLTAHGVWHLLGALSFYFWYRHFVQFEPAAGARSA